ncbi:MAG TPA: site-2 protease family protein [Candidatus Binatia bacterium]|jgi:membrane-associated protease RseP (regulator of RpoE activity)|nr:site-2 protease family protein [Candidatus Binatia bacterium]
MSAAAVLPRRVLAVHAALLATTALTCVTAATVRQGFDPRTDLRTLIHGIPFAATLLSILLVHESGHYLSCRWHGVRASLPYFLPAPPVFILGTLGAFIRIRSRFPDRRALFDVGASGPWAGFVVALAASAVGLARSTVTTAPPEHAWMLGDSILFAFLTRLVLRADPAHVVLHDVAFAGWVGLLVTSLNLLPAGQLDGGHVLYAAAGRRTNALPGLLFGFLVWLGLRRGQPIWFFWGGVVALMMLVGHPPTEDDAQPLGSGRLLATLATLALFVLTFVPEPIRYVG